MSEPAPNSFPSCLLSVDECADPSRPVLRGLFSHQKPCPFILMAPTRLLPLLPLLPPFPKQLYQDEWLKHQWYIHSKSPYFRQCGHRCKSIVLNRDLNADTLKRDFANASWTIEPNRRSRRIEGGPLIHGALVTIVSCLYSGLLIIWPPKPVPYYIRGQVSFGHSRKCSLRRRMDFSSGA